MLFKLMKKEIAKSRNGGEFIKLSFYDEQGQREWFFHVWSFVHPVIGLGDVYQAIKDAELGQHYDVKWRHGEVSGRKTQIINYFADAKTQLVKWL